jgi:hypothetical protein
MADEKSEMKIAKLKKPEKRANKNLVRAYNSEPGGNAGCVQCQSGCYRCGCRTNCGECG